MTRIAITGAAGNVGRRALDAFADADHEVTPITHREHDDLESEILSVEDRDAFVDALDGQDVLVHLAANPSPSADWDAVFEVNVGGTYNAYEAAVRNDLDRVVFASSNHAVHMYNVGDAAEPESLAEEYRAVTPDDPPFPDSYYGVSKVAGEALGNYYAERHGIEVVNLRIGWLLSADDLAGTQEDPETDSRFARAMWLSPRDCERAIRAAATADLRESPVTVHAVSRNDDRYLSLTHGQRAIGYRPRDDATEALGSE
ncbi:NAD-dependent epimerase/dehydratase family protein [Halegenticoccus tardaugens]|uniref:NAD-dependent epimerase/dehydratase family protein n=1 Tax=Halegenticoccus tardaugens TaxID=2071624 RepID=UPI00100BD18F|nr:NAD(P)-dependent oxidoreductase [Halegenticoccus tardaugens]